MTRFDRSINLAWHRQGPGRSRRARPGRERRKRRERPERTRRARAYCVNLNKKAKGGKIDRDRREARSSARSRSCAALEEQPLYSVTRSARRIAEGLARASFSAKS